MTTLVSIIVGAVALSNIGAVLYLVVSNNRMMRRNSDSAAPSEPSQPPEDEEPENETPQAGIGKSKLDYSQIEAAVQAAIAKAVPIALQAVIGEVQPEHVVFAEDEEENATEEQTPAEKEEKEKKSPTLEGDEVDEAFQDDRIDDADPDIVSPQGAKCATMHEIEDSVNTAMNPDATPEQQAKAGKILDEVRDTELMERLMTDKDIERGVMRCIKESFRAELAQHGKSVPKRKTPVPKTAPAPKPATAAKKAEKPFTIADDLASFNPEDLI